MVSLHLKNVVYSSQLKQFTEERSSNRQTDGDRKSISDDLTGSVQKCGHQDIRHRVTKYIIYVSLQITFSSSLAKVVYIVIQS